MLEINTGLICACLPTLKPFVREVMTKPVTGKLWSFRKFSENENALEAGKEHHHRAQLQRSHNKAMIQITPSSSDLSRLPSESTLSGSET